MSDLDLDLLREWSPTPVPPSPDVREHARARLEHAYEPTLTMPPLARRFGRRFVIAAVAATLVLAGAVFAIQRAVDDRVEQIKTVAVPKGLLGQEELGNGPVNILVIGSDSRVGVDPGAFGTPADTGPPKSDTMILLRVDATSVRGLWIPRDLQLASGALINSAFNDGPAAAITAVEQELGVNVDHYVEVDFRGFQRVVDELDGVTIFAPGTVRDSYSGLNLSGPGCRTLDGATALAYVRARHLQIQQANGVWADASPQADLDRQARQQDFVRALAAKAKARAGGDPVAAVRLADALIPALKVDSKFSTTQILGLVRALVDVDPSTLQLGTVPVEAVPDDAHLILFQPEADAALAPYRGEPVPPTTTLPPPDPSASEPTGATTTTSSVPHAPATCSQG